MSRTNRFLGGAGLGAVNMVVTAVVGLWLTRFFLRLLGQRDLGYWLIATQVINYLMLIDFGLMALLPRQAAYAVGRAGGWAEARELPELVGRMGRLVLWQLPILALAMLGVWLWLPAEWEPVRGPLSLVFVSFVVLFPLRIPGAVLAGLQDLAFLGIIQFLIWGTNAALTVALLVGGYKLTAFAVAYVASQALGSTLALLRLVRKFPGVLPRRLPRISRSFVREQFVGGGWISLTQISQILLGGTDLLLIGRSLGPAGVVPYSCTTKLVMVLQNQPQLLMQAASPGLSELKMRAGGERLAQVGMALGQAMMLASGLVGAVVLGANAAFVGWWVGPAQYGGLALTAGVVAQMLFRHWNTSMAYTLFAFGYERRLAITAIVDGAVTVGASVLLLRWLGVVGVPLGSVVGVMLVGIPANLTALARETQTGLWTYPRRLLPWAIRFAIVAAAAAATSRWIGIGFVPAAIGTAAGALLYVAIVLPLAGREPLGTYVRPRLAALLQRIRLRHAAPEPPAAGDVAVGSGTGDGDRAA